MCFFFVNSVYDLSKRVVAPHPSLIMRTCVQVSRHCIPPAVLSIISSQLIPTDLKLSALPSLALLIQSSPQTNETGTLESHIPGRVRLVSLGVEPGLPAIVRLSVRIRRVAISRTQFQEWNTDTATE